MRLEQYLEKMLALDASDLYLSTGACPSAKVHGELQRLSEQPFCTGVVASLAESILTAEQKDRLAKELELNLAITQGKEGRFRVNIFQQRNEISMVIRNIKTCIPKPKELMLPKTLLDLVMEKRGLVLFVGATGTGKSTSLASLIDHRNHCSAGHIITIEDPIEFTHQHRRSLINQREVGVDTESYQDALENTLRQAPDVILIGEIRCQETMEYALSFAETGHLCLSTLHASNANQALERIINFFPDAEREQLLLDLSLNIKGIVSQRLVPSVDNKRLAAFEILLGSPMVQELIKRGETVEIKGIMEKSEHLGMQTFDSALFKLFMDEKISKEHAILNADSKTDLRLRIKQHSQPHLNPTDTNPISKTDNPNPFLIKMPNGTMDTDTPSTLSDEKQQATEESSNLSLTLKPLSDNPEAP